MAFTSTSPFTHAAFSHGGFNLGRDVQIRAWFSSRTRALLGRISSVSRAQVVRDSAQRGSSNFGKPLCMCAMTRRMPHQNDHRVFACAAGFIGRRR